MRSKFIITFAGVPGSSKSPIAHHLGWNLNLPVFTNDIIRTEVTEDLPAFSQEEYLRRRDERLDRLLEKGESFIYDASVDRSWNVYRDRGLKRGYELYVISLDLSRELLVGLYGAKNYPEGTARVDLKMQEHDAFLKEYGSVVGLHITDDDFKDRLSIALEAVKAWLVE